MERADRLSAEIPVVGLYDQRSELTDSHIVSMIVPQGFCCRYPDRGRLILSRLLHKEFIRTRCSLRQTSQGTQQFGVHCSICLRSEEHTSELQSRGHLVCRLLLEKKK